MKELHADRHLNSEGCEGMSKMWLSLFIAAKKKNKQDLVTWLEH